MKQRILLGVILALGGATGLAQDPPALVEYYGQGVHEYFSADIFEANRLFSQAIDGGIGDPRAYYFRSMTLLRMGFEDAAVADMEAGAYLEARAPSGAYNVDRSLQRLQGRDRLALEKVRRRVRFEIEQQRRAEASRRFEETQQREAEVLRRQRSESYDEAVRPAAADAPTQPAAVGQPSPPAEATTPADDATHHTPEVTLPTPDPASEDANPPATEAEESEDPFGDAAAVPEAADPTPPPVEADPATDVDPLGNAPADPAAGESVPTAEPDVGVGQKVKGGKLLGILGSIFSGAAKKAMPQPPAVPPIGIGGGADGPFGGQAEQPPVVPPPVENAPADTNNPFGDGEDPFGGTPTNPPSDGQGDDAASDPATDNPFGGNDAPAADGGSDNPFGGGNDSF